jgi:V/A-type H+-transporting ATPase subunit E
MSLDKLAEKIAGSARSEAATIVGEAKAEAKKIKSEAQQEAASIVEQLKQSAEQEAGQLGTEMSAAARQHNQKRMLIAKREELDTSWQSVQSMVGSAALKGRVSVLKTLMALAKEQNSGKGVLRPVAIDRKVLEDLGRKFTMGDDIDGLGGFVIESDGGTVSMDYRFESRLEAAWDDNLAAIAETLFS